MVQRQVAFEKTKQQQETLTLSDISPRWAINKPAKKNGRRHQRSHRRY